MTWLAFKVMLSSVPRSVWIAMFVLAVVVLGSHALHARDESNYERGRSDYAGEVEAETRRAEDKAHALEIKHTADIAAAVDAKGQADAKTLADRDQVIAGLRAGAIRLRKHFTCPSSVSDASTSAGVSDQASQGGLSESDAEFLVRFAGGADEVANQLTACQAIIAIDSDRQ